MMVVEWCGGLAVWLLGSVGMAGVVMTARCVNNGGDNSGGGGDSNVDSIDGGGRVVVPRFDDGGGGDTLVW